MTEAPNQKSAGRRAASVAGCVLTMLFWTASSQQAATEASWEFPEFTRATEAFRRGNCDAAWKLMWPLARTGNYDAIYFLDAVVTNGRVIHPGRANSSYAVLLWHMLTLSAYSAAGPQGPRPFYGDPNHRWARKDIPNILHEMALGAAGDEVSECYRSTRSFKACLDLAIAKGVIDRFSDYVMKVDAEIATGPSYATCRSRP